MSDGENKAGRWEQLAKELGAEPSALPQRPSRPTPPPTAAVSSPAPAAPAEPAPTPKRRSGWDELTSWLGLGGGAKNRPDTVVPPPTIPPAPAPVAPPQARKPSAFEPPPASATPSTGSDAREATRRDVDSGARRSSESERSAEAPRSRDDGRRFGSDRGSRSTGERDRGRRDDGRRRDRDADRAPRDSHEAARSGGRDDDRGRRPETSRTFDEPPRGQRPVDEAAEDRTAARRDEAPALEGTSNGDPREAQRSADDEGRRPRRRRRRRRGGRDRAHFDGPRSDDARDAADVRPERRADADDFFDDLEAGVERERGAYDDEPSDRDRFDGRRGGSDLADEADLDDRRDDDVDAEDSTERGSANRDGDRERSTEEEPGRRRRRRRRRGRSRSDSDRPASDLSESAGRPPREHRDADDELDRPRRTHADETHDDLIDGDLVDGDADGGDGEEFHHAHKGIPTWDEAVGVIIQANLESRAKNPQGSGGSRGGRGRGGRDRRR